MIRLLDRTFRYFVYSVLLIWMFSNLFAFGMPEVMLLTWAVFPPILVLTTLIFLVLPKVLEH
jgi:hypothetical protein